MPPRSKTIQALKAMKNLGYSEKSVRPVINELLRLYEDNWMLIEDDGYRVLVEAILNSEEQKAHINELKRPNASSLKDDDEENKPLNKKTKRGTPKNRASTSAQISTKKNYQRKKKNTSSPQLRLVDEEETEYKSNSNDENNELNTLMTLVDEGSFEDEYALPHGFLEAGNPSNYEPLPVDVASFEVPLAVIPPGAFMSRIHPKFSNIDAPTLVLQGSSHKQCYIAKESCSICPEVIDLDSDDECTVDDMHSKEGDLEAKYSEQLNCKNPEPEKVKHDPLKLDIASSSGGDAKIFLTINASVGPDFRVPTIETMLKMVEEQCLKSYKIPQAGFSLLGIMKEVCECFLEAGTTSNLGSANEICSSKEPNSEIITELTVLKDPVIAVRNPFEFSPRIPRFIGSIDLDLIWSRITLNVDVSGYVKRLKKDELSSGGEIVIFKKKQRRTEPSSGGEIEIFKKKELHYHFIEDITKFTEACMVSLINEVNGDECPAFNYISRNLSYRNADLSFPLERISKEDCCMYCVGDCLSVEIPCNCAGKTGFNFAYTLEGLVKESLLESYVSKSRSLPPNDVFYCRNCPFEECNGHVNREFIKECWCKCGCGMKCGNRVVQRRNYSEITGEGKGWGLRTLEDVPKGAFICEYVGEVVTIKELFERNTKYISEKDIYLAVLDGNWSCKDVLKDNEALCLDATAYGNVARFINHRCFDGNLVGIPVEVESPDRNYYHLAFFTTREVDALEELTWDYGIKFGDSSSMKDFKCCCGSKFCRDHVYEE